MTGQSIARVLARQYHFGVTTIEVVQINSIKFKEPMNGAEPKMVAIYTVARACGSSRPERLCAGVSSQKETQFRPVSRAQLDRKKNLGEYSWKLANFVRHHKLLITKVSACEWPGVQ